jgi:glucan 1,4-alpha-glucosidase
MVNHFTRVLEKAAKMKIMVNSHESVRLTGLHRTYPNWISAEAARGNEFNAWSKGNPPEHETILPFTRLNGGTNGLYSRYLPDKDELL